MRTLPAKDGRMEFGPGPWQRDASLPRRLVFAELCDGAGRMGLNPTSDSNLQRASVGFFMRIRLK